MAGFGKELVWNWKGVRIVLEERRNGVGREMELQWKEVGSDEKVLAGACAISLIRGRAVVVGVRENADFPPCAISTEFVDRLLLWKGRSERRDKTTRDTILAPGDKGLHPII
eukprot:scaffold22859_cov54-Cyclotella_meneghiniana.AAC.4